MNKDSTNLPSLVPRPGKTNKGGHRDAFLKGPGYEAKTCPAMIILQSLFQDL